MAVPNAMKQIGNKNIGIKLEIVEWSNKMDLLAFSNEKGEVMIHRLKWKKLWMLSPPEEDVKVRGICWRPDEKLIAIAYSIGKVIILDIENKEEVYSTQHSTDITCLHWTQNTKDLLLDDEVQLIDGHKTFLPQMPNLNSLSSTAKKQDFNILKFYSKKSYNLLMVGLANGIVDISVFGTLPCAKINVLEHLKTDDTTIRIRDAKMSADFRHLFVSVTKNGQLQILVLANNVLAKFSVPLLSLAIKHGQILNTMSYINDTIQSITEAWETVLLEMDNKLNKYANSQPEGSLSADFLELLMFGHPSEALDQFLTRDLTEKGIKKLGNSIELSYSTIQKLVVKPLHISIINVFYHLSSLEGMLRNSYYYKPLMGNAKNSALSAAGSFLIKAYELQQTIDTSTRDYKIFFRWLYVAIIRLMDESVPDDISNVTQQDINYLADFLNNFDRDHNTINEETATVSDEAGSVNKKFNLERVGQYLQDKPLADPITDDSNLWDELLEANECLKNCELIYPHHKEMSLVQEHNLLVSEINRLFEIPETVIAEDFKLERILLNMDYLCSTHVHVEAEALDLVVVLETPTTMLLVEIDGCGKIRVLTIKFEEGLYFQPKFPQFGRLTFKHVQFYNSTTISILLRGSLGDNKAVTCFMQQSVVTLRKLAVEVVPVAGNVSDIRGRSRTINAYDVIEEGTVKIIENMDSSLMAVSGSRKVAAFITDSLKGIRLYEMEVEMEEDEDIDESHNLSSLDNSKESNKG